MASESIAHSVFASWVIDSEPIWARGIIVEYKGSWYTLYTVWHEIFAGVYFCGLTIFCVLQELIFAIRTGWFFLLGINFCDFRKYPVASIYNIEIMNIWKSYMWTAEWRVIWKKINIMIIIIFSFLLSTYNRNTYFQTINQYFVVSEWKRQVVIEQTRFLSTVFLCSEFKLENIYSGVNFCGKNVCGNFYLRELIFTDRWKNRKKRKN